MLRINLFRNIRKSFNHTSADATGASSTSVGVAESSKTETPEFVSKFAIPNPSTAVPEIIHSQSWRALKVDDDVTSNKYFPPSPVSRRTIGNKLATQSKTDKGCFMKKHFLRLF